MVGHAFKKRRARVIPAKTTGNDLFLAGALPKPASFDIVVRAAAATAVTVECPAGAAIKATRPVLGLFHGQTLLPKFNALRIAFGPDFPASV